MYNACLISSGNLWPWWGDQEDNVLYWYGLKYGETIEAAPYWDSGGSEGRKWKGTGYSGQEEQIQLPGISEEFLDERSCLYQAVRAALHQADRFDCGSQDAHILPTIGKNGLGGVV